jgi:uncharacterized protein (DUF2236 family)
VQWYALYGLSMRPVPEDYAAFEAYWEHMLADVLQPTEVALGSFAQNMALPAPFPWLDGPPWWVLRPLVARGPTWVARGTLPPAARETLGLSWSRADELALRGLMTWLRASWPLVPEPLRWHPRAWKAVRRAARERPSGAGPAARSTVLRGAE